MGQLLKNVDEEEKIISPIYYSGQVRNMYFLTEDGLYEVLMQSRKPIAKDVADWIEHSNPSKMLNSIDDEEKTTLTISYNGSMTTNQLFLTEDGLYEVLMQSRKPIAKAFKRKSIILSKRCSKLDRV